MWALARARYKSIALGTQNPQAPRPPSPAPNVGRDRLVPDPDPCASKNRRQPGGVTVWSSKHRSLSAFDAAAGNLLTLNASGGYRVLLVGMDRIQSIQGSPC